MPLFNMHQKNVHTIRADLIYSYLVLKKTKNINAYTKRVLIAYLKDIEVNLPTVPAWWERCKLIIEEKKRRWVRKVQNIFS